VYLSVLNTVVKVYFSTLRGLLFDLYDKYN